jgi:hypothetical protein
VVDLRVDLLEVVIREVKDRFLAVVLHFHYGNYRVNFLPVLFLSIHILV